MAGRRVLAADLFAGLEDERLDADEPIVPLTTKRVGDGAMGLLVAAVVEGNTILPMPPVDRATYDEFDTVVKRLRGKWKRGKGHVFPYDPRAALQAVISTGLMPDDNPHAYFPTPAALAADLVKGVEAWWWPRARGRERMRVLEPSAGWGSIADAVRERWSHAEITCCEIDPLNAATLRAKGYSVHEGDFLDYRCDEAFDVVIGNPPFSLAGDSDAWMTHLRHAWSMLAEGGAIGWIAPQGRWQHSTRKIYEDFRRWALEIGARVSLHDSESFKESGTLAKTCDFVAMKYGESVPNPAQEPGGRTWSEDCELVMIYVDNNCEEMYRRARALPGPDDAFIREAIAFANKEHGGGIAMTEKLVEELREKWPWA